MDRNPNPGPQNGFGSWVRMFELSHRVRPQARHWPPSAKEPVLEEHRIAVQWHRDVTGGSLNPLGGQRLDELRTIALKRVRLDAEKVKPVAAAVLGMHVMRRQTRQARDFLAQQVAEPGAFADDGFEPFQLRRRHRGLHLGHAIVRCERLKQAWFEAIKAFVTEPLEKRAEPLVV